MIGSPIKEIESGVTIDVWVVPGASSSGIVGLHGDRLKVRVTAPPEGGRANREVEAVLSERLGAEVVLTRGMTGRAKTFMVADTDPETVLRKLGIG